MGKMTTKQFKEIFNEVASFDVYGWEGILAMVERTYWENAKAARELGCEAAYESDSAKANIIHDKLAERGYYVY